MIIKHKLTKTRVAAVQAAAKTAEAFEEIVGGSDLGESTVKCASTINTDSAISIRSLSTGPPNRPGDVRVCVLEGVVTLKSKERLINIAYICRNYIIRVIYHLLMKLK